MKILKESQLRTDIHFPIISAVYEEPKKMNWFKRFWKFVTYRRKWQVRKEYVVWSRILEAFIYIPNKFIYDGASVPKALNSLYSPNGVLLYGAPPHDMGYRYQGLVLVDLSDNSLYFKTLSKSVLDSVFNDFGKQESGLKQAPSVATFTLGFAGYLGWRENVKKKCNLYEDFPEIFLDDEDPDYFP